MGVDAGRGREQLPLLAAADALDEEVSAAGVQLRDGPVIAVELLLAGQVVQHDEDGVHLAVLRLLLMRDDLLLRVDDAAELGLVQRFEQERLLFWVDAQHLLDVVLHRRPLGREGVGREDEDASVGAAVPVQDPARKPRGLAREARRHQQPVGDARLGKACVPGLLAAPLGLRYRFDLRR